LDWRLTVAIDRIRAYEQECVQALHNNSWNFTFHALERALAWDADDSDLAIVTEPAQKRGFSQMTRKLSMAFIAENASNGAAQTASGMLLDEVTPSIRERLVLVLVGGMLTLQGIQNT